MADLVGAAINRYEIREVIGEGAYSTVYKAFDTRLERFVAIKIIRTAAFPSSGAEKILQRFTREAKILASLSHPNIVKVLDYGEYEGAPYIVMEFIYGGSLKSQMGRPIPYAQAAALLVPIARALQYAHQRQIVHRDVKPENILILDADQPLLSDFGITRLIDVDESHELTGAGRVVGTPAYMSPEQIRAQAVDGRADMYSLGIVYFEMVTGRKPYSASSSIEVSLQHLNSPIPKPRQLVPDLPIEVEKVIAKAIAKRPEDRYSTMAGFAEALEKLSSPVDIRSETERRRLKAREEKQRQQMAMERLKKPFLAKLYESWKDWILSILEDTKRLFSRRKSKPTTFESRQQIVNEWKEAGTMTINMIAVLEPQRQKNLLTLINREQELRIKDIVVHFGGGRYLLHGFGRFGASALIDQIVEQARYDIKEFAPDKGQGIIMMVRVELGEIDEQDSVFRAIIRDFRFEAEWGKYAKSIAKRLKRLQNNEFTRISESTVENTISIKATPIPGLETSFSRKSDKTVNPKSDLTSETGVIDIISHLLDRTEGKKTNILEKLMVKIANDARVPSRVIIVLDKIDSEKVFKILQNMRLFSDERITFFAVVNEEEFMKWDSSVLQIINKIGFRDYYVPCIWDEDHHLIRDMIQSSHSPENMMAEGIEDFINHIAYKSRGAPGDMVRELIDPTYNTYEKGVPILSLSSIRDKKLIEFNSWQQKFLITHWDEILGKNYLTTRDMDRARIGVYELLEYMNQQVEFKNDDLRSILSKLRVTPSHSQTLQNEILGKLIDCMLTDGLLIFREEGSYRVNFIPEDKG